MVRGFAPVPTTALLSDFCHKKVVGRLPAALRAPLSDNVVRLEVLEGGSEPGWHFCRLLPHLPRRVSVGAECLVAARFLQPHRRFVKCAMLRHSTAFCDGMLCHAATCCDTASSPSLPPSPCPCRLPRAPGQRTHAAVPRRGLHTRQPPPCAAGLGAPAAGGTCRCGARQLQRAAGRWQQQIFAAAAAWHPHGRWSEPQYSSRLRGQAAGGDWRRHERGAAGGRSSRAGRACAPRLPQVRLPWLLS